MEVQAKTVRPTTLFKISVSVILLALSINVCEAHVSVGIGLNVPGPTYYAPAPVYYEAPQAYYAPAEYYDGSEEYDEPGTGVEWVPRHIEDGYWVPGRYVEYTITQPGPDYVWYPGRSDRYHHRHRGYWRHYR
jgi:hypothetical protein